MKHLSIVRYILTYLIAILGKSLAFILTPFIFQFKDFIRNYAWNFLLSKGFKIQRSTIFDEDKNKYYTAKGYIIKRETNSFIGYMILFFYFFLDDDANLDSCSMMFSDQRRVKGLKVLGSYFDISDAQRLNKINLFHWYTFKEFYYWSVIRNGFYNYNYIVEDSILNKCGNFDLPPTKRISKSGVNTENFSEHRFYKDDKGKWFFIVTFCKIIKGKAYGYEIGWRRKTSGGVNQIFRVYWSK
jgi:hypothetical protein